MNNEPREPLPFPRSSGKIEKPQCEVVSDTTGRRCGHTAKPGTDRCAIHTPLPGRRQCEAMNKSGHPCARPPIIGGNRCMVHGGNNPIARTAAKRRLLAMVEPALETLREAQEQADWPTAVRAALGILDRAGFGPSATLSVRDEEGQKALEAMSIEELEAHAIAMVQRIRAAKAEEQKVLTEGEVIEAEPQP